LKYKVLNKAHFGIRPAPNQGVEDSTCEEFQVPKKNIEWLALFMFLIYEAVQIIPPGVFNHAFSTLASAVWGS
jgi:hypothetical protein